MKIRLPLVVTTFILILIGCSTFPVPSNKTESLLVVICDKTVPNTNPGESGSAPVLHLTGPVSGTLELGSGGWSVKTLKLVSGTYQVFLNNELDKPLVRRFEVKPGVVLLFPYAFSASKEGKLRYTAVNPDQQEKAIQSLLNYIDFENWIGKGYVGFGRARPKMYISQNSQSITINTDPQGAKIFLDNIEWGVTPKTLELSAGKYLLRLEKKGFKPLKRIVSVESNKAELYKLDPLKPQEKPPRKDTFSILVYPFVNIQDTDYNPYGNIFSSTFNVNFMNNKELHVVRFKGRDAGKGKGGYPDLSIAAKYGAELAVAGKYEERGDQLFVHAVLYDVQSGRVKYAVLYISKAGFSVFDSIDQITLSFSKAVSSVLPRPGNPILEQEGDVSTELSAYEKQLYQSRIIARRCSQANVLSVLTGIQMTADEIQLPVSGKHDLRNTPRTPLNALKIKYEYILNPLVSLSAFLGANIGTSGAVDEKDWFVDFHAGIGPLFYFRSSRSDIYVGLFASASYTPGVTVNDSGSDYTIGPYFFLGGLLNAGVKYYFTSLMSDSPFYLDSGLQFDVMTFRFGPDGPKYVPMNMMIYVGLGWHL
ncbi:MAG: PEGA domain-containing protein [Spirochaetia bacterium]